jgi:hypothetical protein
MPTLSIGRRARLVVLASALVGALALPAAVSADTTGPAPSIAPAGSRDATVTVVGIDVVGKVVASVRFDVVCQPFESRDWSTGETYQSTEGSIEFNEVVLLQAQGRAVDFGVGSLFGRATCEGTTVNHLVVALTAQVAPWRNGSAVVGVQIYLADLASFQDFDFASSGPVAVRLSLH